MRASNFSGLFKYQDGANIAEKIGIAKIKIKVKRPSVIASVPDTFPMNDLISFLDLFSRYSPKTGTKD